MRISYALLFVVTSAIAAGAGTLDVYILTGQSNSLGTTALEGNSPADYGPGSDPADLFSEFFWANVTSSNARYPADLYGDSGGAATPLQMQQGGGSNPHFWGPEFGLARSLFANNGSDDVLIIKASRGGGGNTLWDKGAFDANPDSGHMWGHLRDTVDAALTALVARGDTFAVKGLLYLQGESNSGTEAALAGPRLQDLIQNLESHMEAQYPGSTSELRTVIGEIAASQSNANRQLTTQQQMDLADSNDDIAFVSTSDLPLKSDGIHFGRDAKLTIGHRFNIALLDMVQLPNGVPGDVNQDGMLSGDGRGLPEEDDISAFILSWRADTSLLSSLNKVRHGDLDLSGATDLADAFVMHQALSALGKSFPFDRLVPEPVSVNVSALGAFGLWLRRFRQ